METLFKDSEVFTKKRPTKITEKQETDLLKKMAQEIIENNYSNSDLEDIIYDLSCLSHYDNGYELAKELESLTCKADYNIDISFIEWLDDFDNYFRSILINNINKWVSAHNIKPKYSIGTELTIKSKLSLHSEFKENDIIYINSIYEKDGTYGISKILNDKRNTIYNFEILENNVSV